MALGQVLLDGMELLHPELQLQAGEADVTRGLFALNRAQDAFEALLAQYPNMLGSASGTVTTAAATETTTFPSGVLRIDSLWYIDASTSRPAYRLGDLTESGGHSVTNTWPYTLISTTTGGKPRAYWTNGTNIYWAPLPDATYTVRYYGLAVKSDIAAAGTFAYPDICILPFATFAAKLVRIGLDDPTAGLDALARETFGPVLKTLGNFQRTGGAAFRYTTVHNT